jgi:uncharacterized protein
MSTNNHIDLIEFPARSTEELQKTTRFLTEVFGWKFKDWGGQYADTADSGVTCGVNATDVQKRQTMPLAVIYASDLEAVRERVVQAGGIIVYDIEAFPGGRRFQFTEPSGNELAVWSEK